MSKTVSARIPEELHEILLESCNKIGCSVNDYIKNAIDNEIELEESMDEEDSKEPQLSKVNEDEKKSYYDKFGNWVYWSKDSNNWVVHTDPKNITVTS